MGDRAYAGGAVLSAPGLARRVEHFGDALEGRAGRHHEEEGPCAIIATGANAVSASNGTRGCVAAAVRNVEDVRRRCEPSRGALATASAPTTPAAPGLFSTITVLPRRLASTGAIARNHVVAPAGKGTTMRMRPGASCASLPQERSKQKPMVRMATPQGTAMSSERAIAGSRTRRFRPPPLGRERRMVNLIALPGSYTTKCDARPTR